MAQFDDIVGSVLAHLKAEGLEDNTIVVLTTDNGAEVIGWPDGGQTPFKGEKGMSTEGGFRAPMIVRWPGQIPAGTVVNGIMSSQDWFPTLLAAAGNPNIKQELLKGKRLGDKTFQVHLDGYDQTAMLTGKGESARHEIFYFSEAELGAVRIDDYKYSSSVSLRDGSDLNKKTTSPRSSICASIRSSGHAGRVRRLTSWTSSLTNFGGSSTCSGRSGIGPDVHRSFRRCSAGRASIWMRSRPRSRNASRR